ncbi:MULTISPECIES: glycosyltransferase family 4 protein [Parabacteroides]|uniref:glycosyltransferase family 4 protein n=1 Tax=Parabacteroides TaxID=375288 RepID=UPI000F007091|nr:MULTISPECIES: glycosyltransferase family 4 protein [Parabacteroides]RKU61793.1 glycosyltransferase family 1 protein [Parabacteroides sp. AF17-3]
MIQQSDRILIIGPDPKAKGGMASVIAFLAPMYTPFHLVVTYKEISKIGKVLLFVTSVLKTFYYCVFRQIDVIHIHTANYIDFYRNSVLIYIGKLFNKRVLLHIHGSLFNEFYNTHPCFVASVCRSADALVTVSSTFVKMLRRYGLNEHIYCLPNCVEFPELYRTEQHHNKLRLVFVGRINEVKGIYDVLECLHKYKEQLQDKVELHIGGIGDEERFLKMMTDYNLSSMIVQHGWVVGKEKEDLFCSSDVFIHPSHFESFGIAILEAMSYGLPVITTLIGGIPDFFEDKKSGVAVAPGNVDEIYEAILLFLNDRSYISRMGKYGREEAKRFTPLEIEQHLQDIYIKLFI